MGANQHTVSKKRRLARSVTVRYQETQYERVQALAAAAGLSVSEYIRLASLAAQGSTGDAR